MLRLDSDCPLSDYRVQPDAWASIMRKRDDSICKDTKKIGIIKKSRRKMAKILQKNTDCLKKYVYLHHQITT